MKFCTLPPEINSARMYSGPGGGSLLVAAAAWDQLADNVNSSAAAYRAAVAELTTDGWRGPSSTMMADATGPYLGWLHSTAAHAEQTALQAKSAASAYQAAFAMTVPPPVIAANRARLHALIATNFFGQNSPAIAATEADYARMWAQDAAAMYGYAASASAATTLAPFAGPPNPVAPTVAAQQLTTPTQAVDPTSLLNILLTVPALLSATASTSSSSFSGAAIATTNHALAVNALRDDLQGIGPFIVGSILPPTRGGSVAPAVSAVLGRASLASALSVPQTWAATATWPVNPAGAVVPTAGIPVAPANSPVLAPGVVGEAMLGTLAGRGINDSAAKRRQPGVIPRSPAAG